MSQNQSRVYIFKFYTSIDVGKNSKNFGTNHWYDDIIFVSIITKKSFFAISRPYFKIKSSDGFCKAYELIF